MSLTLSTFRTSPRLRFRPFLLAAYQARLASSGSHTGNEWHGRKTDEHVANRKDELDVQSGASQSGMRERASGDEKQSQATSDKDSGNHNKQAQKDHPEAPGPVIGMNDERGQVSGCRR